MIPPGEFWIGGKPEFQDYSKGSASVKKTPLKIIITRPFYLGIYPVTQAQWLSVMKNNPSNFKNGGDYPVEKVSWDDCKEFIKKLNEKDLHNLTEWKFRLPTEAEWEYACRAGSETDYYWGNKFDDNYCWCCDNSNSSTQPVGKKKPNGFGLFDMSGNVWEWCEDCYESNFHDQNFSLNNQGHGSEHYRYVEDPVCKKGSARVLRGGSWDYDSDYCRSDYCISRDQSNRYIYVGFRLALSPGQ
ncbi:MAG: Serine/threonine-protein kinase pkn1 [bacterium ADurb.Bin243]|nr:MAG: Serine/threonine-protein kinase pkn1 [bacterium ADurb.Bin243]